jgi:poly(3-hydroxybutyrate) depolymerase
MHSTNVLSFGIAGVLSTAALLACDGGSANPRQSAPKTQADADASVPNGSGGGSSTGGAAASPNDGGAANGKGGAAGGRGGTSPGGGTGTSANGGRSPSGGSSASGGASAGGDGAGSGSDVPPSRLPSSPTACPAAFQSGISAGHQTNFQSGGQSRSFDLVLPPATFTGPRPLLVAWHGTGLSGAAAISLYGLEEWANAGFIVMAPDSNGNGKQWPVWDGVRPPGSPPSPNPDLTLFDDLIACVAAHREVDANRIYTAGHSAGGEMTHFILGKRSKLLAGGVPASGLFDLTQPNPPEAMDPMTVIVTWGGDNDQYSGGINGVSVTNMTYSEESAIASQYWESRPGGNQLYCRGNDVGHTWLPGIGGWLRQVLLAHPKGAAKIPAWTMPPVPAGAPVVCSDGVATYKSPITVACATSSVAGCQAYCQLLGDCLVENGTVAPICAPQLSDIGFAAGANVCSGCVANCEADASSAADSAMLSCVAAAAPKTTCGPGFAGAAALATVGTCCGNNPGSKVCSRYCTTFKKTNQFIQSVVTGCP